jgi:hypothetical protein
MSANATTRCGSVPGQPSISDEEFSNQQFWKWQMVVMVERWVVHCATGLLNR